MKVDATLLEGALELRYLDDNQHGIFANKRIIQESTVIQEQPYIAVLARQQRQKFCSSCLHSLTKTQKKYHRSCQRCEEVVYCCRRCMRNDKSLHYSSGECIYLQNEYMRQHFNTFELEILVALRLMKKGVLEPQLSNNKQQLLEGANGYQNLVPFTDVISLIKNLKVYGDLTETNDISDDDSDARSQQGVVEKKDQIQNTSSREGGGKGASCKPNSQSPFDDKQKGEVTPLQMPVSQSTYLNTFLNSASKQDLNSALSNGAGNDKAENRYANIIVNRIDDQGHQKPLNDILTASVQTACYPGRDISEGNHKHSPTNNRKRQKLNFKTSKPQGQDVGDQQMQAMGGGLYQDANDREHEAVSESYKCGIGLSSVKQSSPTDDLKILEAVCVVITNCLEVQAPLVEGTQIEQIPVGSLYLYRLFSRINHDCLPNCLFHFKSGGKIIVRSIDNINTGQQICVSYLNLTQTYFSRQNFLNQNYQFECKCARDRAYLTYILAQNKDDQTSDTQIEKLTRIDHLLMGVIDPESRMFIPIPFQNSNQQNDQVTQQLQQQQSNEEVQDQCCEGIGGPVMHKAIACLGKIKDKSVSLVQIQGPPMSNMIRRKDLAQDYKSVYINGISTLNKMQHLYFKEDKLDETLLFYEAYRDNSTNDISICMSEDHSKVVPYENGIKHESNITSIDTYKRQYSKLDERHIVQRNGKRDSQNIGQPPINQNDSDKDKEYYIKNQGLDLQLLPSHSIELEINCLGQSCSYILGRQHYFKGGYETALTYAKKSLLINSTNLMVYLQLYNLGLRGIIKEIAQYTNQQIKLQTLILTSQIQTYNNQKIGCIESNGITETQDIKQDINQIINGIFQVIDKQQQREIKDQIQDDFFLCYQDFIEFLAPSFSSKDKHKVYLKQIYTLLLSTNSYNTQAKVYKFKNLLKFIQYNLSKCQSNLNNYAEQIQLLAFTIIISLSYYKSLLIKWLGLVHPLTEQSLFLISQQKEIQYLPNNLGQSLVLLLAQYSNMFVVNQ